MTTITLKFSPSLSKTGKNVISDTNCQEIFSTMLIQSFSLRMIANNEGNIPASFRASMTHLPLNFFFLCITHTTFPCYA